MRCARRSAALSRSFHRQLPIAVCRPPIVNHKPCGPNPLPNARSISLAGHWCAAFIGSLRSVWKTCRLAGFFSCRIISAGWTPSSCSSPAPGRSATSSTRNIITSRFCIRSCARLVASRSASASRMLQFAPLRKKSPRAKSCVCSLKASWNAGERCCVCSAVMKSLRGTRRPRSFRSGSINSGDRSFHSRAGNFSGNSRSESGTLLRSPLENRSRQKQPTSRPCARSCSSWANSVSAAGRHWIDILPKTACAV